MAHELPIPEEIRVSVKRMFEAAKFVSHLGIKIDKLTYGRCETSLEVREELLQQNGVVHAGVLATLADHTAGGAGGTTLLAGDAVLSVEFKVNFLRPAKGKKLRCVSNVLKPGKNLIIAESEIFGDIDGKSFLAAKATVTLIVISAERARQIK